MNLKFFKKTSGYFDCSFKKMGEDFMKIDFKRKENNKIFLRTFSIENIFIPLVRLSDFLLFFLIMCC